MNIPTPVCFRIDLRGPKQQGLTPVEAQPAAKHVRRLLGHQDNIEHVSRPTVLRIAAIDALPSGNPTVQAAHAAFTAHLGLTLRPEVLLSMVIHEVAVTVRRDPQSYRHLFMRVPEKATIRVQHDGLHRGDPVAPWHEVLPLFRRELEQRVPPGILDRVLVPFSTRTPETDAALLVQFMTAASPYYDYHLHTLCGISTVSLLGGANDWRKLRIAAAGLAEAFAKHLEGYFDALLPVLRKLEDQAAGDPPDERFWSSVYKWENESGGARVNGWLTAFVHYTNQRDRNGHPVLVPRAHHDWTQGGFDAALMDGSIPAGLCAVPFLWEYLGEKLPMRFVGGAIGLEAEHGGLSPQLGWAVLEGNGQPVR